MVHLPLVPRFRRLGFYTVKGTQTVNCLLWTTQITAYYTAVNAIALQNVWFTVTLQSFSREKNSSPLDNSPSEIFPTLFG